MSEPEMRDECKQIFKELRTDIKEIKGDVKATRQAVVGNGNPGKSLASRLTRVETLWIIFASIAGMVSFVAVVIGIIAAVKK